MIGLGVSKVMSALEIIERNYHWIAGVSGAIMLGIGFLLVSGLWERFVLPVLQRWSEITPPI